MQDSYKWQDVYKWHVAPKITSDEPLKNRSYIVKSLLLHEGLETL